LVVEDNGDELDVLFDGFEKSGHASVEKRRIAHNSDGALAGHSCDACGERKTRAHAEQRVSDVVRRRKTERVTTNVIEKELVVGKGGAGSDKGRTMWAACT